MGDRVYTTIEAIGPNADAAQKAAMEALKNLPKDEGGWDSYYGYWAEDIHNYFDKGSGQGAILTVTEVSLNFPNETFHLDIAGGFGEGIQSSVFITHGIVTDLRSEEMSYGDIEDHNSHFGTHLCALVDYLTRALDASSKIYWKMYEESRELKNENAELKKQIPELSIEEVLG